jgi:hypothetical protein
METLVFDPQNKSAIIQLEDLDRTIKLEEAGGSLPPSAPIHHADLIKEIMTISHKHLKTYNPKTGNITIKAGNCKRIMWKGEADVGVFPVNERVSGEKLEVTPVGIDEVLKFTVKEPLPVLFTVTIYEIEVVADPNTGVFD